MQQTITCPVCNSSNSKQLYPNFTGTCITSDMQVIKNVRNDNYICRNCGLIFNARGTRDFTGEFYKKTYKFLLSDENASSKNFCGSEPISHSELTLNKLNEMVSIPESGTMLEIGAGKGEFLEYFTKQYPHWETYAIEPTDAYKILTKRLTKTKNVSMSLPRITRNKPAIRSNRCIRCVRARK